MGGKSSSTSGSAIRDFARSSFERFLLALSKASQEDAAASHSTPRELTQILAKGINDSHSCQFALRSIPWRSSPSVAHFDGEQIRFCPRRPVARRAEVAGGRKVRGQSSFRRTLSTASQENIPNCISLHETSRRMRKMPSRMPSYARFFT